MYDKQYANYQGCCFFVPGIVVIRFQLALLSVNMDVSLPWNISGEPQ